MLARSTPGNTLFRKWLSRDEVFSQFVAPESLAAVEAWLNANQARIVRERVLPLTDLLCRLNMS